MGPPAQVRSVARLLLLAALSSALVGLWSASGASAATPVAVFPIPGTHYNRLQTQITFRGIPASQIGALTVTGSKTGNHPGQVVPDSDGDGGSFIPNAPFATGETVTVKTKLDVIGGSDGTFTFQIGQVLNLIPYGKLPVVDATADAVQHFASRRDLEPAALTVSENHAPASAGDIFVAQQFGPLQDGPMILDPQGKLIWFLPFPVSKNTLITNFQVQNLHGQRVLTWWQGNTNGGEGRGVGVIYNSNYQQIATVRAGNGLDMGLHEFLVTPQGDAYILAASPVQVPGISRPVIDSVIQEIDIKTGLVLFEWHALDHIPLSDSYFAAKNAGNLYDPFHANSVALDSDGNLIVSMRNTSAIYKIDHQTGQVIWTLGGKHSTFKMGTGTTTWGQHDAVMQTNGTTLSVFDDGAGPPRVHPYARGVLESLDYQNDTATLIRQYVHSPQITTNFEGSMQLLPGGDVFLGWGQQPYFSEYTAQGQQDFDAHFNVPTSSYRAYRFAWSAQPATKPALAVLPNADGSIRLAASWNGATDVASWRALGGSTPSSLSPVGSADTRGFETTIVDHSAEQYFAVQALGANGQTLATSAVKATPAHLALYGRSAFVSRGGFGAIPASCFTAHACHITTTLTSGRTVIAKTSSEGTSSGGARLLYFQLTAEGKSLLQHASSGRLPVSVSARDSSGVTATSTIDLVPYYTSGSGPHRSLTNSKSLQIIGTTQFVSGAWVGGILAGCMSASPCSVASTVSVGQTAIAQTGKEFMGADELGYLSFTLTSQGHALLEHASGNQLGVRVTLDDGSASASGALALVSFK